MDAQQFFLEQHGFVQSVVADLVLGGLSDEQLRLQASPHQLPLAWLLWHGARWEDVVVNAWIAGHPQMLDQGDDWLRRLDLPSRHVGTGRPPTESAELSARVDLAALRAYWQAVGDSTKEVVAALAPEELPEVVEETRLAGAEADGAHANEQAPWLDQFFSGRTKAWHLAFVNVHNVEHLIGQALAVRAQAGFPLGL
jgi:hypothetical protein